MSKLFYQTYVELLQSVLRTTPELNKRTGEKIFVLRGGQSFQIELSELYMPLITTRRTFPKVAAAEVAWFISGTQSIEWLKKHTKIWDSFVEKNHKVEAAYGYRWRKHFHRDQLRLAINALKNDPSNRQINISAWDPATDGLGQSTLKNIPCPTNFTLSIVHGELHCSVFIRSSDIFVGLPYDVMGYALLVDAFAAELGVSRGTLHVTLAHAHFYEIHKDLVLPIIESIPKVHYANWSITDISKEPDEYVSLVAFLASDGNFPTYNPHPEIVV